MNIHRPHDGEITNQPIKWQQLNIFWHTDVVKTIHPSFKAIIRKEEKQECITNWFTAIFTLAQPAPEDRGRSRREKKIITSERQTEENGQTGWIPWKLLKQWTLTGHFIRYPVLVRGEMYKSDSVYLRWRQRGSSSVQSREFSAMNNGAQWLSPYIKSFVWRACLYCVHAWKPSPHKPTKQIGFHFHVQVNPPTNVIAKQNPAVSRIVQRQPQFMKSLKLPHHLSCSRKTDTLFWRTSHTVTYMQKHLECAL